MTADELDDLILEHLDGGAAAPLDAELVGNPEAGRRLAELALQENLLSELGDAERIAVPAQRSYGTLKLLAFAAAILVFVLLLVSGSRRDPAPAPLAIPKRPVPEPARELPPQPEPAPPKTPAPVAMPVPPSPEPVEPPKSPEPRPIVREPRPKEEPKPVPIPEPAPKSTPDPVVFKPVAIAAVRGAAWRRVDGKTEALKAPSELGRAEQLVTTSRRAATVVTGAGCTIWLEKGTTLAMEQRADGAARVTLAAGSAVFSVEPRTAPFVVATEGEVLVTGTLFLVDRSSVAVLEGSVKFRNEKGEVAVKAGQRSTIRAGERPSPPVKTDVEAAAAWRLRPELSDNPERAAFADHEPGANRKVAGLAIAAPYTEGEEEAGRLARAVAERLDAGLALGHHYRDLEKKRWINVDRGMEAEVRADGTLAPEAFTDGARKATADYLDRVRAAAGVGARDAAPMVVQIRSHYLDGEAGELAVAGWNRATMAAAKAYYAQLLEKHKPAVRLELRFQGVDKVQFTEDDARIEGYMAGKNARNAAAFFLPAAFGRRAENVDAYAKILGELIEFLYLRRR